MIVPPIVVRSTFVVANQTEMLALAAETGDVAVRTDQNKSYRLQGIDPSVLGDWQELLTPVDAVLSVFGRTGAVVAQSGDYAAYYAALTHAAQHKSGGGDSIKIDEFGSPTDNTNCNVSGTAHGLVPKLPTDSSKFFCGDGSYVSTFPTPDYNALVKDPGDGTKRARLDVGAVATSTTRVVSVPNRDLTLIDINDSGTDTDRTWSASKINTELGGKIGNNTVQLGPLIWRKEPLGNDDFICLFTPVAYTINKVYAITNQGTVTFQLKYRTWNSSPFSGGTNILSSSLTATSSGVTTTGFVSSTLPAEKWIALVASAMTGNAGIMAVAIVVTVK